MDFHLSARAEEFRAEVRAFLDEHLTPGVLERARSTGTMHDWGFHRALADRGWLAAAWPEELGGQGRDPFEMMVLDEELARRAAPVDGWGTSELVAQTLRVVGRPDLRDEIVPAVLRGEILICLGYSEPDSGSDVAAARTRAQRRDDGCWVIDGQKIFTTLAHESTYVFLLARTDPAKPKHRGLTMFLVPLDAPGLEVAPVATLGGERTNMTYYNGVVVPDRLRVGEVDGGWDVMRVALAFERQPTAAYEAARLLRRAEAWAAEPDPERGGRRPIDDVSVRERLARVAIDVELGRLLALRLAWATYRDKLPIVEGSMAKLHASEALVRASSDLLDLLGASGSLPAGEEGAPAGGWVERAYRHAPVTTIYAGTSEIQRSVIAEQALGLPSTRPAPGPRQGKARPA